MLLSQYLNIHEVNNISFKDMIENYQPGSIDISKDAIVTRIEKTPLMFMRIMQTTHSIYLV